MTKAISYVCWGGKTATVPAEWNLGVAAYRKIPAYGVRRVIFDAAFGYVCGFKVTAIVYYVFTRSLSRRVAYWSMRAEGVEFAGKFGSLPMARSERVSRV